jgi:hypothetical protein
VLWAIGLGLVACTVGVAYVFVRGQRVRAPTHTIGAAPEARQVRIRGTIKPDALLESPVTKRPCVYSRVELRVWAEGRVYTHLATAHTDFAIDDGSGIAQVLVERAHFEVVADIVEMGRASQLSEHAKQIAAHYCWPVPDVARTELCEAILAPGASVEVAGVATREPLTDALGDERGYRDGAATALVFSSEHVVRADPRERRYIGRTGQ